MTNRGHKASLTLSLSKPDTFRLKKVKLVSSPSGGWGGGWEGYLFRCRVFLAKLI